MRRRRGPGLIGTAIVVGGAAHMGAKSAENSAAAAQQEAAQTPSSPSFKLNSRRPRNPLRRQRPPSSTKPHRSRSTQHSKDRA